MRLALLKLRLAKLRPRKILNFILRKLGLRSKGGGGAPTFQDGIVYGVDRLLLVSGFGAFASGWMLSPRRHVLDMSLFVGGQQLEGDRRCLSAVPRSDLATPFAEYADLAPTAGFQTVFRGTASELGMGALLLRVHLDDGTSPILKVSDKVVRPCDTSEALAVVASLFPSLPHEPFRDAFAAAFEATVRRRAGQVVPIVTVEAPCVVLVVLPRQLDDVFLAFAEIRRSLDVLPPDVGVVFMTSRLHRRTHVVERFGALRRAIDRPVSLFEIGDPTYALWSVTPILAHLGAARFWFCGPDVMATGVGWRAACSYFAEDRSGLELFLRPDDSAGVEAESLSFAWSSRAFGTWAASAPFFLSGFYRDNHLPADPAPIRISGTIGLLRTTIDVEPIRRADEQRYQAAGAGHQVEASS